jgi:hypothetical protein
MNSGFSRFSDLGIESFSVTSLWTIYLYGLDKIMTVSLLLCSKSLNH